MYSVELYARVRRACHVDGLSERAAARFFGIDRKTVSKILKHSVPPGYRRSKPPVRPKLDPFLPIIDQILEADRALPRKQRHTAHRIFERLRDEHGFTGGITIVTDYVREKKRRTQEVFVPLSHPPGHAQADFGEALGEIGGVQCKLHYFAMALPHSDAFFIKAYPAETTEALCDGHVSAFAFFGGVPLSILFDNTTLAVAKILGDGTRKRTITFSELPSHYLFEDRFGRPGKGNDKGNVEGVIGFGRRNFLVPMPRFESFEALNDWLEEQCLKRQDAVLRGHSETIGERLLRDLDALRLSPFSSQLSPATSSMTWALETIGTASKSKLSRVLPGGRRCKCRMKNPQKCRTKIPHIWDLGSAGSGMGGSVFRWATASFWRRRRGDGGVRARVLGDKIGVGAKRKQTDAGSSA